MRDEPSTSPGLPGWRSIALLLIAGAAGAGLLWWQDTRARQVSPADPLTRPVPQLWPEAVDRSATVAKEVRAMKLVTVEVRTRVTSTSSDSSVLGDVSATVTAPVRLLYGTDLGALGAGIESSAVMFSPLHGTYMVTVPPPTRLAAEVLGQFEQAEVKTGWMRKRATDGEYHLGLARRDLSLKAQQAAPDDDQAARIRQGTREQVETLVRKVVGTDGGVVVRFADEVVR